VEKTEGRGGKPDERGRQPERKGAQRPRGDSGGSRPPQEQRRRRNTEQRYAGWGDEVERAYCTEAAHELPSAFPVAVHGGAATIPRTIVARREGAVLLCTYSHCGPHVWPDGEIVEP
jgi:hypothetical protein